jgi:hypothetical protein
MKKVFKALSEEFCFMNPQLRSFESLFEMLISSKKRALLCNCSSKALVPHRHYSYGARIYEQQGFVILLLV